LWVFKSLPAPFLFCLELSTHGFCRYNCREEFQIHDDLLKANYAVGRISEAMLEHYLVQVSITATPCQTHFSLGFGDLMVFWG